MAASPWPRLGWRAPPSHPPCIGNSPQARWTERVAAKAPSFVSCCLGKNISTSFCATRLKTMRISGLASLSAILRMSLAPEGWSLRTHVWRFVNTSTPVSLADKQKCCRYFMYVTHVCSILHTCIACIHVYMYAYAGIHICLNTCMIIYRYAELSASKCMNCIHMCLIISTMELV